MCDLPRVVFNERVAEGTVEFLRGKKNSRFKAEMCLYIMLRSSLPGGGGNYRLKETIYGEQLKDKQNKK